MEVIDLKHQIQSNTIPNFLIFSGDEYMVQRIYIKQIAKVKNLTIRYIDSVSDIFSTLGTMSLLGENYCYVVIDDKDFMQDEKMQAEIQNRLKSDTLILRCISLDKRLKFFKTYKSSIIDFEPLKSQNLAVYLKREIDLSDRCIDILMEICENSYGRCLLEIDKIKRYSDEFPDDYNYNQCFQILVQDGTIYTPPRDAIFDFVKAVLQNKPKQAYELLQDCKEIEEPTLVLLSVLYKNARAVAQVQTCKSSNIEKSTGLNGWEIRNAKECVGKHSENDLVYLMKLIQSVEQRIKTGEIEDAIGIDYVLAKFF